MLYFASLSPLLSLLFDYRYITFHANHSHNNLTRSPVTLLLFSSPAVGLSYAALPDCAFTDPTFDLERREAWVDEEVRAANAPEDLTQIVLELAERVVAVTLNPRWSAQESVLAIANGAIIEQLQLDTRGGTPSSGARSGGAAAPTGAVVDAVASVLSAFILFTVTLCANPAHDLTCPPSYIII